jgi:hypothetical protein
MWGTAEKRTSQEGRDRPRILGKACALAGFRLKGFDQSRQDCSFVMARQGKRSEGLAPQWLLPLHASTSKLRHRTKTPIPGHATIAPSHSHTRKHGGPTTCPKLALQRPDKCAPPAIARDPTWASSSIEAKAKLTEPSAQEYHDVNRTYNDVAQALSQYPSLSPRTDVHSMQSCPDHPQPNLADILLRSLSRWLLRPAPPSVGNNTGPLPRRQLPLPHIVMGSPRLPPRASAGLRDPDSDHDGAAWAACRPAGSGLSSLPCRLVDILGCKLKNVETTDSQD